MDEERKITDADANAIAEAVRTQMLKQFYQDLGKGIWGLLWRAAVTIALAVAAYGSMISHDK